MVLIDDPEKTVIEPLFAQRNTLSKVYDTDLMMNGGHITGYKISDRGIIDQVVHALTVLAHKPEKKGLLFAMGDGNHSLATAKAIWQKKKTTLTSEQQKEDPARFALVELVNVYDE